MLELFTLGDHLRDRNTNVAAVADLVAEYLESPAKLGVPDGTRAHIYSPTVLTKVDWDAQNFHTIMCCHSLNLGCPTGAARVGGSLKDPLRSPAHGVDPTKEHRGFLID